MQDGRHLKFPEIVDRLNNLIADTQSKDEDILNLLSMVISQKELTERNASNQEDGRLNEQRIYSDTIPLIFKLLETRPLNGKRKDNRHELRMQAVSMLSLFHSQIRDEVQNNRYLQLIKVCFRILMTDSEEIATVAIKILNHFVQLHTQQFTTVTLNDVREEVVGFCESYFSFLDSVPALAQKYNPMQLEISPEMNPTELVSQERLAEVGSNFQTFACRSLKIYNEFLPRLLRREWIRPQMQNQVGEAVIEKFKEKLITIFQTYSTHQIEARDSQINMKSIVFYLKAIEVVAYFILPLTCLLNSNLDFMIIKYGDVVKFFVYVARSIPGNSPDTRLTILQDFYQFNYELARKFRINQNLTEESGRHANSQKQILKHYLEYILDQQVLLGNGQPSETILWYAVQNVLFIIDNLMNKELKEIQFAKAIQFFIICIMSPACPFTLHTQLFTNMIIYNECLKSQKAGKIQFGMGSQQVKGEFTTYELQIEILTVYVMFCKQWRKQCEQGVSYFLEQEKKSKQQNKEEEFKVFDSLTLRELELVESSESIFSKNWKKIQLNYEKNIKNHSLTINDGKDRQEYLEKSFKPEYSKKEMIEHYYYKTIKNVFEHVEKIIVFIKEATNKSVLGPEVMKLLEKLLVHISHIIHCVSQFNQNQEEKQKEIYKALHSCITQLQVNQFRDILNSVGDTIFGLVIEARARGLQRGMPEFSRSFLVLQNPNQQSISQPPQMPQIQTQAQRHEENFKITFIELFFEYTKRKIAVFDTKFEELGKDNFIGLTKQDKRLASLLPFSKIQEALQRKLLAIGEQCLTRANDVRVKHTFFGIFTFCIQKIRSGQIVPKYFFIIRNLWKEICNIDDHSASVKEIQRDYIPMIQGLIQTFLQQKDEVNYVKWPNEICCFVPAKLKHLLDYLPEISKPLVDCLESNVFDQIEGGAHTLQYWLSALATYPELLDPVLNHIMPDMNKCIKQQVWALPNISLKLLGKLGSRTRQYDYVNEFKPRNYSEDGLKICLTDKHSQEKILLGIDQVIDVLLIKILSSADNYSANDLKQAVLFVRSAFLSYIDPEYDIDFIIANIISVNQKDGKFMNQFRQPPLFKSFDARKPQEIISQMTTGSESHVFEKILRCLIIGCSTLPTSTQEYSQVQKEHINFMEWVTKYFTLIYICKNGTLTQPCQIDEINPLLFIEYVVEFLYFNVQQGNFSKQKSESNRPYYKGSSFAIKTMLRLINQIYKDKEEVYDNLEIIELLIKKICNQVDELAKNLAVNIAIKILVKHLPQRTVKKNAHIFVNTLFKIIQQSNDSVVQFVCGEIHSTIEALFEKIGVYTFKQQQITTIEDRQTFISVVEKVVQTVLSQQSVSKNCAKQFIEKIAKKNNSTVCTLLDSIRVNPNPSSDVAHGQPQQQTWIEFIYQEEFERKIKDVFDLYYGSFSAVKSLISFIEVGQFLIQHSDHSRIQQRLHVFLGLMDMLVLILEDESDKFESVLEHRAEHVTLGPNSTLNKLSKRYMKLERIYLQQNREYDSYSHTMHTHQFLETNYFEVISEARDQKFKKDIEQLRLRQSWQNYNIFDMQNSPQFIFERLQTDALQPISELEQGEQDKIKKSVKSKIESFTSKLFGNQAGQGRVQDICYDYMQELFEIYPNVSIHCKLISKALQFLCDIASHPEINKFVRGRQSEFFREQYQTQNEETKDTDRHNYSLISRFDYYAVEVKAKMICIFFKFFQRDESIIQKQAKNSLKRLLSLEITANEALPNYILKECVRPILNSMNLSQGGALSQTKISYYQHFGKLIKVCNNCFNEELGRHLTQNYNQHVQHACAPYLQLDQTQYSVEMSEFENKLKYLIDQYNTKIRQIETACGIIDSLHFLCQQRPQMVKDIKEVMLNALQFNEFVISEFQPQFDDQVLKLIAEGNQGPQTYSLIYDRISPLRVQLGHLKSDLQQGVAKFFTSNFQTIYDFLSQKPFGSIFLKIISRRENFVLREKASRESFIKFFFQKTNRYPLTEKQDSFDDKFVLGINLVYIFSKFHPQYLVLQKNSDILDILRQIWVNKVSPQQFLSTSYRDIYQKILKILVIYSKNEKCDTQILFDLLKDFNLQASYLDMRPLIKLCTQFIPQNYSVSKQIKLMGSALEKIQRSQARYEAKYCMFEFSFMPIALRCAKDFNLFKTLFTAELKNHFFYTFFQIPQTNGIPLWRDIKEDLQQRQKISYQNFFTEIVKVVLIIVRFTEHEFLEQNLPPQLINQCLVFLDNNAKYATDQSLRELSYFTMSSMCVKYFGLPIAGEPKLENQVMISRQDVNTADKYLKLLKLNVLGTILENNLNKSQRKQLLKLSLQNVLQVYSYYDQSCQNIWELVKLQFQREPDLQSRITFCALIADVILQSDVLVDIQIYRALSKTIFQFQDHYHRGFDSLKNLKDPFTIIDAIIHLTKQRKNEAQGNPTRNQEIQKDVYELFTNITCIFEAMTMSKNFDYEQDIYNQYSQLCLKSLKQISEMFPAPESYSFCIGYEIKDLNRYQYQALFKLNFFSLSLAENFDLPNKMNFLLDFLKLLVSTDRMILSISSINFRLILLPIYILKNVIRQKEKLLTPEQLRSLKEAVSQCIKLDFKKVNSRSITQIQFMLVELYNTEQQRQLDRINIQNPQVPFISTQAIKKTRSEELELMQKFVPHFAIRTIKAFEDLRDEGAISQQEFESWIEPEYYKSINNLIYKLVCSFRLVVTSEKIPLDSIYINQPVLQLYENYEFKDNMIDFSMENPNFDTLLKESIVIGIKSIVLNIKNSDDQDNSFQLFDLIRQILKYLKGVKSCWYLTEQMYEITKMLVIDKPTDRIKIVAKEKACCLIRLINTKRLKEPTDDKDRQNNLVNKVYELCLDFLDQQPNLQQNEVSSKIFDKLFQMKPNCSYQLRQRLFQTFENFNGSAIKHKINYFMFKLSSDDYEQFYEFCQIKELLDFLLYSFRQESKIKKLQESSNLISLQERGLSFQVPNEVKQHQQYHMTKEVISEFVADFKKQNNLQLEDMLVALSEIIRINPDHSHDRGIAEKIFSKIFWQIWENVLQRQDQHQFAADINKMGLNLIKYYTQITQNNPNQQLKNVFIRIIFEQVVSLRHPQVRIEPEVLQFLAKNYNLWHIAIPMLEDHIQLFPLNERYVFALQELYDCLLEEDYSAGLSKVITHSQEMRSLISYSQHHKWEDLNTQFSAYINFYAEQEGLFPFLEQQQRTPGKYSRQLAKNALIDMINGNDPCLQQVQAPQNQEFTQVFETREVEAKLNPIKFPKAGSNRSFTEIDLRTWETLYLKSLKILKVKDLFKDIADNITNDPHELKVDYYWTFKEMNLLSQQLRAFLQPNLGNQRIQKYNISLNSLQKVRYHLYQSFLLGTPPDNRAPSYFEENHKETVKLVINQWAQILPQYMDRIHNEYLILFQQIIESMEGGRNMISIRETRSLQDYRCAMNIWRERLPNISEPIETWQDILESRNFIFATLRDNIKKQQQTPQGEVTIGVGLQEEPVDICWNNLKLAEVSRKHGLLGLAHYYLNLVKAPLTDGETKGEILKLERYRFMYENFKLHMSMGMETTKQQEVLRDSIAFIDNKDYDSWMHADIQRLSGEYFLQKGDLNNAKTNLLQSIEKNRKEAKTWLSYAKLNETVFRKVNEDKIVITQQNQEKVLVNVLKGYFFALSLSQHKARLIIPSILCILKIRGFEKSAIIAEYAKRNIEQLPAWIWLFWMPQLLSFLKQPKENMSHNCATNIFIRLCRLYPQAVYYSLKAKCHYTKREQLAPIFTQLKQKCQKELQQKNPKAAQGIEFFLQDVKNLFSDKGDKFIYFLQELLNFSFLIHQKQIERKILKFYQTGYDHYLKPQGSQTPHPVASEFYKHFIDEKTREPNFLEQMRILKNMKDFLVVQKSLKVQTQHIQDVLPNFSSLNSKGIELPDQYIYSSGEPLPQRIITIERIDTTVHRSGWNDRKIEFKCQNSKSIHYLLQGLTLAKAKQAGEITQFYSDQLITQMKIIMNMMFQKHKESHIRGVKLHVSPKILLLEAKLSQDDLNFVDFQETHDFLLLEQGIDPDQALLMQLNQIKNLLDNQPADKVMEICSIDQVALKKMNQDTYNSLTDAVEPFLLQSYINRIFYNVDNLFIFKKQFTKYLAVSSFFSYVFNQADQLKLNSILFCKSSGKVNFSDCKLSLALEMKDTNQNQQAKIQQLDKEFSQGIQVPFRLTPNLVHFIGQIGLQGLFAGVMTSAALALEKQQDKLSTLLRLIFADEIDLQPQPTVSAQQANQAQAQLQAQQQVYDEDFTSEFTIQKIRGLVQHSKVLPQPPKSEESRAPALGGQRLPGIREDKDMIVLGNQVEYQVPRDYFDLEMERPMVMEEFNQKVYKLIDIAQDDSRRSQKPINWCAWF